MIDLSKLLFFSKEREMVKLPTIVELAKMNVRKSASRMVECFMTYYMIHPILYKI